MSQSADQHRAEAPSSVRCAVVTVSDSRTLETDTGGLAVVERLRQGKHEVVDRQIVPDEPERIRELLAAYRDRDDVDAILITGGTGISRRDRTFDVVNEMLTTPLPGYGELFRMLSYEQVGAAAMLSRATGGLMDRKVLLTMPGSPAAVHLAMGKIILKELAHLVREARR